MTKMTMRNTVEQIKKELTNASKTKAVKANKNLLERLVYTSKALAKGEKVGKKDLLDLSNECFSTIEAYAETQKAAPKGEASVKKAPAKKAPVKKSEEPKKAPAKKAPAKKEEAKKAPAKKQAPKKAEKKAEVKNPFPASFKDEDGTYTLASDIETLADLRECLENDEDIVVAAHWTKDDLKEYDYGKGQIPKNKAPKSFDNDLDLLTVVYVGENVSTFLTVSLYTEVSYYWTESSMKSKKKIAGGIPYEIYRYTEN